MAKLFLLLVFSAALTSSCIHYDDKVRAPHFDGTGYQPVYMSDEEVSRVSTGPARPLTDPGKIYLLEPYLFVNERGKGIHVIDNTDPADPKNIAFISIPGNHDMAAKGEWLYADNYTDLLTFHIADPQHIVLTKRTPDAIPAQNYPPQTNVFFECADAAKGAVVAWEKVEMNTKPKCWR